MRGRKATLLLPVAAARREMAPTSHKGENNRFFLKCDREGKSKPAEGCGKRVHGSSRLMECPWEAIMHLDFGTGIWRTRVKESSHNHEATIPGSHAIHRKIAVKPTVLEAIEKQTKTDSKPSQILTTLRLDEDEEVPMFKRRNIYNIKQAIRATELGSHTMVQALMIELHNQDEWFIRLKKDRLSGRIQLLFFGRKSSQKILKLNPEVLIIDATYKKNRYRLPLVVINGVTALNISFYMAMAFIDGESIANYKWVLRQLKDLYKELNIPFPVVILTNHENALIRASGEVFPHANLLYKWHIDDD